MVTPAGLEAYPACSAMGTALPGMVPGGTCTVACITPATMLGAPPAYCTNASRPSMNTVTGSTGTGSGADPGLPSTPAGLVAPSPVAYTVRKLPATAGWAGPFICPSPFTARACPLPEESAVNQAGDEATSGKANGAVATL